MPKMPAALQVRVPRSHIEALEHVFNQLSSMRSIRMKTPEQIARKFLSGQSPEVIGAGVSAIKEALSQVSEKPEKKPRRASTTEVPSEGGI